MCCQSCRCLQSMTEGTCNSALGGIQRGLMKRAALRSHIEWVGFPSKGVGDFHQKQHGMHRHRAVEEHGLFGAEAVWCFQTKASFWRLYQSGSQQESDGQEERAAMEPQKRELWRKPDTGDVRGRNKRNKYPNLLYSLLPISRLDCLQKNSEPFFLGKSNFGSHRFPLQHVPWRLSCHLSCFSDHQLHLDKQHLSILILKVIQHEYVEEPSWEVGVPTEALYLLLSSLWFNFWFV